MRISASSLGAIAVASGALLGAAMPAHASVRLDLTDVTGAVSLTCDTAFAISATNCNSGSGFSILGGGTGIGFNGTVGGFTVFTTTFVSNMPGDPAGATLDGSTTQVRRVASGQGDLRIDLSGFGYTMPAGVNKTLRGSSTLSSSDGSFAPTDLVFNQFIANAGNVFPVANVDPTVSCTMSLAASALCNTSTLAWADPLGGTFSMRDVQLIRLSTGARVNTTISGSVNSVPEPMTLSLVGAGLLGAAFAARRRNKMA